MRSVIILGMLVAFGTTSCTKTNDGLEQTRFPETGIVLDPNLPYINSNTHRLVAYQHQRDKNLWRKYR